MNSKTKPREVKVRLLGDTGVGKSILVQQMIANNFKACIESEIGATFMSKVITVNDRPLKFQIWDTEGQEKYPSLAPMYYRGTAAAIIVYDITRVSTFKRMKDWVEELQRKGPKDVAIVICGTNADLEEQREVDKAMTTQYAEDIGAMYLETSTKDDTYVEDLFVKLSHMLPAPVAQNENVIITINKKHSKASCY